MRSGDREESELPGDWAVVMGKEKASLGTEQRPPFPFPTLVHQKHETSSNTDYQRGKIKELSTRASQGLKHTQVENPGCTVLFSPLAPQGWEQPI